MVDITTYTDLLRQMVATPSLSHDENAVCSLVFKWLVDKGIATARVNNNIIALNRHYDPSKKTLALDAHLDTVPPAKDYTRDPLDPGQDPDIVWGLGSNDDGGSVVSMIAAFEALHDREDLNINLMLTLSCEEECSGPSGARYLYNPENGYFMLPGTPEMPSWVIVGEPTGMRAATSERGLLVLDAEAHGVSGHAARGDGVNALYIALNDIARLREHRFSKISPLMGEVHLSVTQILAGSAHNVIPDSCSFVIDIRPTEQYTNEEILAELQTICQSSLKPRNLKNRSSATRPFSPLAKTAKALGIETFSSPTTSDWMRIGCDCIKMGPGDSTRSHHADEYILTSEIADAINKYIQFITEFNVESK